MDKEKDREPETPVPGENPTLRHNSAVPPSVTYNYTHIINIVISSEDRVCLFSPPVCLSLLSTCVTIVSDPSSPWSRNPSTRPNRGGKWCSLTFPPLHSFSREAAFAGGGGPWRAAGLQWSISYNINFLTKIRIIVHRHPIRAKSRWLQYFAFPFVSLRANI